MSTYSYHHTIIIIIIAGLLYRCNQDPEHPTHDHGNMAETAAHAHP